MGLFAIGGPPLDGIAKGGAFIWPIVVFNIEPKYCCIACAKATGLEACSECKYDCMTFSLVAHVEDEVD